MAIRTAQLVLHRDAQAGQVSSPLTATGARTMP